MESNNETTKRVKRNYPVDAVNLTVSFAGEVFKIKDLIDQESAMYDGVYDTLYVLPETMRRLLVHGLKQKLCDGHASLKAEVNTDDKGKPLPKSKWRDITDEEIVSSMSGIFQALKAGWSVKPVSADKQAIAMLKSVGVEIKPDMLPEELAEALIEAAEKLQS